MSYRKGFTLIEMLIVLSIIGILLSATYPSLARYKDISTENDRARHEYVVNKALKQYYALTGKYPNNTLPVDLSALRDDLQKQTGVALDVSRYPHTYPDGYSDPDGDGKFEISSLHVAK